MDSSEVVVVVSAMGLIAGVVVAAGWGNGEVPKLKVLSCFCKRCILPRLYSPGAEEPNTFELIK